MDMVLDDLEVSFEDLNPFVPGAGRQPRELLGRDEEFEHVAVLIRRTQRRLPNRGVILTGLRGMGKTVLMRRMQELCDQGGLITAWVEARREGAADDAAHAIMDELKAGSQSLLSPSLREKVQRVIESIGSISLGALGVSVGLSKDEENTRRESLLRQMNALISHLAASAKSEKSGVVLFVDELQDMSPTVLGELISLQHEAGQRDLPFYLIGGGLPNLPRVLTRSRSYAERLFEYRRIGSLPDEVSRQVFQQTAQSVGSSFDQDALNLLVGLAQGYPFFIQAYGDSTWDAAHDGRLDLQAVKRGMPQARAQLDTGLYSARWQRASAAGQGYLRAMAEIGAAEGSGDEVLSSRVAQRLGRTLSALSPVRATLIGQGLIYMPRNGAVAFTVPHMGEFVLRQKGL